jgi:tetratricopeptide (TPR) repeat protein
MNIQQSIEQATQLHRAGHLQDAEQIYRRILAIDPNVPDALQLLGILVSQLGRHEAAVDLIRKAIALDPGAAVYNGNLGLALHKLDRLDEAAASFQTALNLGSADPNIFTNFADTQRRRGKVEASIALCHRALALAPNFPDARNNLGIALVEAGRFDEAIDQYRIAIRLRPQFAEARNNLGNALVKKRLFRQAIAEFQNALSLRSDYFEAMMNMGVALQALGETDRSIDAYRRSLALRPEFQPALINLGQAFCDSHRFEEAIAAFRKAIAIQPDDPAAHIHLSGVLLLTGNFSDGWGEYEWRLLKAGVGHPNSKFAKPRWTGQDLAGKRILLHSEQGAGDLIQFCRLSNILTQRGAHTILSCPPQLLRLFRSLQGVSQLVGDAPNETEFDYHCYLLSLPLFLGLKLETIPTNVPYLHAEPALCEQWRAHLAPLGQRRKIGLVWAGNPMHTNDHNRSIPLASFAPLAEIDDAVFISLQKGGPAAQPPAGLQLIDRTAELSDYAATAALIANLDLVISADTSVAHLAGAMGKPVWTLIPFYPDLRWLLNRSDSPWYPTMRLFRQTRPSDWQTPIRAVTDSLASFVRQEAHARQ